MEPAEKAALELLLVASQFFPPRPKKLVPELVKLAEMILSGDPVPADYLQGLLDLGEADLQGQAAAMWG